MEKKPIRVFAAVFTGMFTFFFFYAFIAWATTRLAITPYGRFVSTFFKGRTKEESKAFIEANKPMFDSMVVEATRFANFCMTPLVGFVTGIVVGLIIPSRKAVHGVIWSLLTVAPIAGFFWFKSATVPNRELYLLLLLAAAAVGGALGNRLSVKFIQQKETEIKL